MQLTVNEQVVDITLENETNAFDIIESLSSQIEKEIFISSIRIDNRYFAPDDKKSLKSISLKDIDQINIEVGTREEISITLLQEANRILQSVAEDLKQNGFSHEEEIGKVLAWVLETVQTVQKVSLLSLSEAKLVHSTLTQVLDYIQSSEKEPEKIPSLTQILLNLNEYVESIQLKISGNFNLTQEEMDQLIRHTLEILPEIAEAFQIGKDSEALEKIHTVINLIESCSLYIKKNLNNFSKEKEEEIGNLYDEFNSLLEEILTAFENTDFILIGDLMEYELPEKLENYQSIILEDTDSV